ncbi:MAG TPA: DivIVA domain-containing protein [Acidimicrobiales bacterium]
MAPNSPDPAAGLNPDDVARRTFSAVRKGYDPIEVQGFLVSVASELREARMTILELDREVRAAQAEADANRDLDPSRLTTLLGEEMSRVLEAARSAADELRAKAVADSAQLLDESRAASDRMRSEAAEILVVKTAEAEAQVAEIRSEGEVLREQAKVDAAAEVEAGRQAGREMVAEAQKVRERMLQDLARRRKAFRQQIEGLQAGRDRLLSAYDVVRETLDVATGELQVAMPEARLAAESASLRPGGEDEPTLEDLEREAANLPPTAAELHRPEAEAEAEPEVDVEPEVDLEPEPEPEVEEDKRKGRRSSSVNVIRVDEPEPAPAPEPQAPTEPEPEPEVDTDAEADAEADVSGLFARLREETGTPDDQPAHEDLQLPEEAFELVEEVVIDQTVVEVIEVVVVPEPEPEPEPEAEPAAEIDPDHQLVARRDAAMVEVERTLSRRIKRELSDEQNELLDAVRRQKGVPTVDTVLPALDAHLARYREAALPGLAAAATSGADLVDGSGPATKSKVGDLADALASELIAPLRDRIANCFREAAGDDEELAERLRACYREWKGQRVDEAATRLGLAACNRGLLDSLAKGTLVHWIVDDGENPSPDCDDNALAGDLVKGEAFPTGHLTPPISAHCRCLVAPRQG